MMALRTRSMVKVGTKGLGDQIDYGKSTISIVVGGMFRGSVGLRTNTMVVVIVGVTTHQMSADSQTRWLDYLRQW